MIGFRRLTHYAFAAVLLAAAGALPAHAQTILSGVGGVCLNVEGGVVVGARIIGWPCSGGSNERWTADGSWIKLQGTNYCITAESRNQGAQLRLKPCNNDWSLQNFAFSGTQIKHNSGYVVDLKGAGWWNLNDGQGKPAILWSANGGRNQAWYRAGIPAPSVHLSEGQRVAIPGKAGTWVMQGGHIIGQDGAGAVAQGGGNVVATGGGNVVATGGGNVVATGGGN